MNGDVEKIVNKIAYYSFAFVPHLVYASTIYTQVVENVLHKFNRLGHFGLTYFQSSILNSRKRLLCEPASKRDKNSPRPTKKSGKLLSL